MMKHIVSRIRPLAGLLMVGTALCALIAAGTTFAGNSPTFPNWHPSQWKPYTESVWKPITPELASDTVLQRLAAFGDTILTKKSAQNFIRIGRLWHMTEPSATFGWNSSWPWPGGITAYYWNSRDNERYSSYSQKQGSVVGVKDWEPGTIPPDPLIHAAFQTVTQPYLTSEVFRMGFGGIGSLENAQVQRWLPSQVYVNGVQLHDQTNTYVSGPGSASNNDGERNFASVRGILDEKLPSERMLMTAYRWSIGLDVYQQIHGWSAEPDQDYLLYDYHFVNIGNVDNSPVIERPNKPLNDLRYAFMFHASPSHVSDVLEGSNDDFVEFFTPWPSYTDAGNQKVAVMQYDGDNPDFKGPDFGGPGGNVQAAGVTVLGVDLWAKAYQAIGWIFAEKTPGSGEDDPAQPKATTWAKDRDYQLTNLGSDFQRQYRTVLSGDKDSDTPKRAPIGVTQFSVGISRNRPTAYQVIGWDQLPYNGVAHAVLVVAAGGLSDERSRTLGGLYVARKNAAQPEANWQTAAEIAEIATGRDSMKKSLDRAFWNIYGYDPNGSRWPPKPGAFNQAFNVPDPPRPPAAFWATAGDGRVDLEWTTESKDYEDPDTKVKDWEGYRVYRSLGSPDSTLRLVWTGTANQWSDTNVVKGFLYFYAVTAYDNGSQNWENPGVKLESGKFSAWTGWYDLGVRPSGAIAKTGADLSGIRVVPNPYNVRLAFPAGARKDEIVWKNLPVRATIRVYTAAGALVHTINHTIGGSEPWDLKTTNNQYIATGVYIYTIDSDFGSKVGKFIVIR